MQPDFMAMAKGQGQTQEPITPEEKEAFSFSEEDYAESGFTPGDSPEAMKARLTELLQKAGLLEGFSKEELRDLAMEIDNYVKAIMNKDIKVIENSYITQMLSQIGLNFDDEEGELEQPAPTGGPVPQANGAPKNFAGMMPGGGMGGR